MINQVDVLERDRSRGPLRSRRWIGALIGVAVVVIAVGIPTTVWFVHWRASLHSLVDYPGYGVGGSLAVDRHQYFGQTAVKADADGQPDIGGSVSLTVTSVHPVVTKNTANAEVVVARCVLAADGDGPLAVAPTNCSSLVPFTSGRLHLGFRKGDDDLVIVVTPRRAGTVRVAGVRLAYSSGMRHGVQHVGGDDSITTKP